MIFDFDGVVVDSEPVHLDGFRKVLATVGVEMTPEAYYGKYLGYDDRDCITLAARDRGVELPAHRVEQLIRTKTRLVQATFRESVEALPGAVELIGAASEAGIPLAICSGALRQEIELAARTIGVLDRFSAVVPAEDVARGKPNPAGYELALRRLRQATGRELAPERCVVVEDSPAGIDAAGGAGMRVLAVATSYPTEALAAADRVAGSLAGVTLADAEALTA